jgi:hypothetical protein
MLPFKGGAMTMPARYPVGEQIVPHTPGTVGSIARQEARTNPRTKLLPN